MGTLIVAGYSAWYAQKEYNKHMEEERTKLLCDYNHRYSTDKYIEYVIEWMLSIAIIGNDGSIIGVNRDIKNIPPSIHQKEMFLRFFEELYLQIKKDKLDKQEVFNLFGYYALIFDKYEEFRLDITDYEKNEWSDFRSFIELMKNFE